MQYLQPNWPAPKHIKAYTTLRDGWQGRSDGNSPLKSLLDLPADPIWITQIHSSIVIEATSENTEQTGDASFTSQAKQVCVVLTADCLPILISNKRGTKVAAIHAGWRGLAAGIIENTVQALSEINDDLLVWLGPAIGPKKFEVGKDVFDAFTSKHLESAAAFLPSSENKWLANLYELARIRLKFLGISAIYGGEYCTHTQDELFFSYRRDQGKTGRMASLIWID